MGTLGKKRYHIRLLQAPVLTNDLGEMSDAEVYGYVRGRVGAIGAENLMFELQHKATVLVEFTTARGLKAMIEITHV